jgi:hypothetical protein
MQENLSRFAGCVVALSFSGFCLAGEGAATAPTPQARVAEVTTAQPLAPQPTLHPMADWLDREGSDSGTLLTALLGLGLLATVVYRARTSA